MKFVSWNVNGLRACEGKGFSEVFRQLDADFFCLRVIGTMPRRKATPVPPSSRVISLSM